MDHPTPPPRTRNPRGHGKRLGEEILQAAGQILDREGREEAVSLRAVARRVGITAPSIYQHFRDREELMEALVDEGFTQLQQVLQDSHAGEPDAVSRLMAGSFAYLDFAGGHPHRYRLMFTRTSPAEKDPDHRSVTAFGVLVTVITQCVEEGRSASSDPFADAAALWAGLHGLALLRDHQPGFPWPDRTDMVDHLVRSLARID